MHEDIPRPPQGCQGPSPGLQQNASPHTALWLESHFCSSELNQEFQFELEEAESLFFFSEGALNLKIWI